MERQLLWNIMEKSQFLKSKAATKRGEFPRKPVRREGWRAPWPPCPSYGVVPVGTAGHTSQPKLQPSSDIEGSARGRSKQQCVLKP